MSFLFNLKHKGKISLILLLFVIFEIIKSTMYKSNFSELSSSFSEVYSDRVLAQDYIFKLSDKIHERQKLIINNFQTSENLNRQLLIRNKNELIRLLNLYSKTKLTTLERQIFVEFEKNIFELEKLEQRVLLNGLTINSQDIKTVHLKMIEKVLTQLHQLSYIQISEARLLNENTQKLNNKSKTLNHFEWFLIIGIAICIQAIIFSSKTLVSDVKNPNLN